MIKTLSKATHNFVEHQLREEATEKPCDNCPKMYTAKIDLIHGQTTPLYFYIHEPFLKKTALALLGDDTLDKESIEDLSKEIANLIAGSAKILAAESEAEAFDIGIPSFEGQNKPQNSGTQRAFYINNELMLSIVLDKG